MHWWVCVVAFLLGANFGLLIAAALFRFRDREPGDN